MKKATHFVVTFFCPGTLFAESYEREVVSSDPYKVEFPENAYCFQIHSREDVIDGATVYRGSPIQIGPTYYHPDSKVETIAQAQNNKKSSTTLLDNMRYNKWEHIVWSRYGNWPQPYVPGDHIVLEK